MPKISCVSADHQRINQYYFRERNILCCCLTQESLPLQTNDVKGSVTVQQAATSSGAQAAPGENRTGPSISAGQEEGAAGAAGTAAIAVALEQANDLPAIKTASGRLKM